MKSNQGTRESIIENTEGSSLYKLYRVSGNYFANYDLADFPFDTQELNVVVEILCPEDRVKISFDQSALLLDSAAVSKYKVTGWNRRACFVTVDNMISRTVKGDPHGTAGVLKKFKNFAFHLRLERVVLGSFLQIILPLVLIGLIGVALLFIRDLSFENVGEVSIGLFLSIIAFSIALNTIIPSSNSLTRADMLFWLTFVVVFASFMIIILLNILFDAERVREIRVHYVRTAIAIMYPVLIYYALFW